MWGLVGDAAQVLRGGALACFCRGLESSENMVVARGLWRCSLEPFERA